VALFFWIIGVAGFALRPENAAARVHLFFTCAMAAYFAMGVDYDFRADLGRFYPLSIYLLAATAIHLGLTFPGRARVLAKWPALLWANYGVFLAIGLAAAVVYQPLARPSFPAFDTYMVLYWQGISVALLLGVLVLLGALIGRVARPPTYQAGQQAKIALFGATAAFLPMAAFWAVPTIMKADPQATTILANSSLLFFLCFPAAVGYAIVRTKLFDIDLIIRRTLQYAFLVAVLGFGYFAISVGLGYALQTVLPRGAGEITNAVAAAAVAFAFAPLSHRTQAFLDKVFARGAYDPTLVLIEFGVAARHATEPAALFEAFQHALDSSFKPVSIAMNVPRLEAFTWGSGPSVLTESLRAGTESLGVASVGKRQSDLPYHQVEREFFVAVCHQLALAVENNILIRKVRNQERVTKELEIAHQVQAGLLPGQLPEIPGTRLAAHNQAAHEMGGDFYDFIGLQGGAYGIVLGDVSGKGVPAALLGAVCLTLFRAIAPLHQSPIEALEAINKILTKHRASKKMFVAVTYVIYHPESGWVVGVNAGNPAPLHSGEPVISKGMPLGFASNAKYCDFELILDPGETLVLLSDGMTDARNAAGQRYGDDRFNALIGHHAESDPADLVRAVNAELAAFQRERSLYDDLTIVALRRIGRA